MAPNICGSSVWNLLHVTLLPFRTRAHKFQSPGRPGDLIFLRWRLIFMGLQYLTCFTSPFCLLGQELTNSSRQVARATTFFTMAPNIYGSSVWNLLHVTLLASRNFKWHLEFSIIHAPLFQDVIPCSLVDR
jgi:hypothetical protein